MTDNTKKSKTKPNQNIQNNPNNITVIPETPLDQQNQYEENTEFLSPSLITKTNITTATPTPIDTSTPTRNYIDERLKLHQLTIQPKPEHLTEAKKTATQLQKMGFIDTGCLINAYTFERNYILALAMYYTLGRYDPSESSYKLTKTKTYYINTR